MKKLKKATAIVMILIMALSTIVCGNTIKSYAASAQFTISLSSKTVKKGNTVKVSVKLSCSEAIGAYTYCLTYDSSVLEYSSGDGNGGGGTITCAGYGDGSASSSSNSFTFTAVGTGSSYVGTSSAEVYTWSEASCSASNAGATVTVTSSGSTDSTESTNTTESSTTSDQATESTSETDETDTTEEDSTEETTEELSDNCLLSSLEISPGELNPEFSSEVYTYETTVSSDVTSLAINAIAEDSKSTVKIEGNDNFEPGNTSHVTITVTAETGDNHIYDILVTVEEAIDSRYVLNIDGTDYYFTQDYSKLNIPEGFAEYIETVGDYEVILYASPNGLIKCAYLTDEEGNNGAWYIVDLDNNTISPLISVLSSYTTFIILEADDSVVKPEGYTAFSYEFSGNEITAYRYTEADDIILVYAMTSDTQPCWYRYDTEIKTFVRYIADTPATGADEEETSFLEEHMAAIIITCAIVFLIMLVIIIVLAKLLKSKAGEDDENNDTDFSFDETDADTIFPEEKTSQNADIPPTYITPVKVAPTDTDIKPRETAPADAEVTPVKVAPADADVTLTDVTPSNADIPPVEAAPTDIATSSEETSTGEMTELKPNVTEAPKDIQMPKKNDVSSETNDIIKQAAQYSSLNTADLSEVFNMAESIVNDEENSANNKNNASLQFKPIKNHKPEDSEE